MPYPNRELRRSLVAKCDVRFGSALPTAPQHGVIPDLFCSPGSPSLFALWQESALQPAP